MCGRERLEKSAFDKVQVTTTEVDVAKLHALLAHSIGYVSSRAIQQLSCTIFVSLRRVICFTKLAPSLRAKCAEITGDRPRQRADEVSTVQVSTHEFSAGINVDDPERP